MCGNQRVDHDPKAAVELPEDVGVRHGVACARKAAPSVRVGSEGGSGGVACANPRLRASAPPKFIVGRWNYTPSIPLWRETQASRKGVPGFPLVPPAHVRHHAHLCSGAGHALKPAPLHLYLHLTYSTG